MKNHMCGNFILYFLILFFIVNGNCEASIVGGDCKSISDSKLRLECFDSLNSSSSNVKKDTGNINPFLDSRKKFDSVLRSGSRLIGATEAGVTYVHFSELLGDFSGEVSFLESDANTELEKEGVKILRNAVEIYRDSATIWTDIISANSNPSMQLAHDFVIFGFYPNTAAITGKYALPWAKDTSFFSGPDSIYGPGARNALWEKAEALIANTKQALRESP